MSAVVEDNTVDIDNTLNTVNEVVVNSLWLNKSDDKEYLRVDAIYPHKYVKEKAKVDVTIKDSDTKKQDNFSKEYLLKTYKRVM